MLTHIITYSRLSIYLFFFAGRFSRFKCVTEKCKQNTFYACAHSWNTKYCCVTCVCKRAFVIRSCVSVCTKNLTSYGRVIALHWLWKNSYTTDVCGAVYLPRNVRCGRWPHATRPAKNGHAIIRRARSVVAVRGHDDGDLCASSSTHDAALVYY